MKIHAGAYQHAVANLEKERKELYRQIYEAVRSCTPGWSESTLDEISITQVGGAMTNFIFIVSKPEGLNHKVLLRIYGEGTDLFFPRDREINTFQMLSERNIGIKFLGEFDNGRVERLIEGTVSTIVFPHACILYYRPVLLLIFVNLIFLLRLPPKFTNCIRWISQDWKNHLRL